jgi:ADP-heptose:LPS heptosyltransferase
LRILLIRLRLVGDVVFTTPAINALAAHLPGARLTYLVERGAAPVVRHHPDLEDVWEIDRPHGVRRLALDAALAWRVRRARFDAVIDFHGGPRAGWLAWASRAPVRVGYTIKGRAWLYTLAVHRPAGLAPRHSVENQWDLVRAWLPDLGAPDPDRHRVVMHADPAADAAIDRRLAAAALGAEATTIVVHVSAGNPFRRWPQEHFATMLHAVSEADPTRRIILTSGPSEADAAGRVAQMVRARLGRREHQVVPFGETTLPELRALIARAQVFVGGDSGPLHVAATTDTPVVALFGPTLAARSAPWRPRALVTESIEPGPLPCRPCEQRRCEPGDFRCLTWTGPDLVAGAVERALRRARERTED